MNRECPACQAAAPVGLFCGYCGAGLDHRSTGRRALLRPGVFAAAPRERVWRPSITTSLFPRLGEVFRLAFRHALFLVLTMLVGFSMLRLLAPLVIVTALGIPLLFLVYLWESGALRSISPRALLISVVLGVAGSVAWWLWTTGQIARAYGVPLAAGAQLAGALDIGLTITLIGAVLMILPAVAVRLLRIPVRESLDGFVVGSLGALLFSASGTITWFAPQFVAGLINNYGGWRLFEEAFLYGLVDPLTSAAAGGLAGLALWFRPRESARGVRVLLVMLAVAGVGLYMGVYMVDAAALPRVAEIAIHSTLTAASLLTARLAIQVALLYEIPDPTGAQPILCGQCKRTVPCTPVCVECGAAKRASSGLATPGPVA